MNGRGRWACMILFVGTALLLVPDTGLAYGGPGSVVTGIGALLAVLAAVLASIFGFLWFPLKRLVRRIRPAEESEETEGAAPVPEDALQE